MKKTVRICMSVLIFCSLILSGCGEDGGQEDSGTSSEQVSSRIAEDAGEDMTGNETVRSETQTDDKENAIEKKEMRTICS